jgi:hypothetical protein
VRDYPLTFRDCVTRYNFRGINNYIYTVSTFCLCARGFQIFEELAVVIFNFKLGSNLIFIVPFGTSNVEFGTEVWLVSFGIM